MNRIRLLPEHVANQIAAGEVVERPASVVKELVENALDAGARRISVEIQAGGRSLIRVTDDGSGMSRDDALLCLERHATSKIQKAEDLSSITTMGFRGEAIPSIASVSRMMLTTREATSDEGAQIIIHGGKILEVKAAGCAPGSVMEVRQLFFNLPARRKFLRTEETERAHVQHYLTLAALAHPQVGFTFTQDGRIVWQLPPVNEDRSPDGLIHALRERMRSIYGGNTRLLPVEFQAQLDTPRQIEDELAEAAAAPVNVWGLIGAPGVSRATREEQHLFVNRRPVENRGLNYALLEGYHTALMKGRYPVCCLFIEIHPSAVDVNIHPSNREVKFHQEQAVRRVVAQAVRQALLGFHGAAESAPSTSLFRPLVDRRRPPNTGLAPAIEPTLGLPPSAPHPTAPTSPDSKSNSSTSPSAVPTASAVPLLPPQSLVSQKPEIPSTVPLRLPLEPRAGAEFAVPEVPATGPVPLLRVPLRIIGVVGKLYVVLESDRGLVLVDQHAAHERILFEQMMKRMETNDAPSQRLLLPETVELSPRDAQFLREQLPFLTRLGVGLSEFGERTFLLDALPPFIKLPRGRQFILELVDELKAAGEGINSWRLGEHTITKTVCRHAVKANDPLSGPELENLIEDLRRCEMPYTCPHGRPTIIEMNFRELEKKFGRSQ